MSRGFELFEHAEIAQQRASRTDQALADPERRRRMALDQHDGMADGEDAGRCGAGRAGTDDQHVRSSGYAQFNLALGRRVGGK